MSTSNFEKFKNQFSSMGKNKKTLVELLFMCLVSVIIILGFNAYKHGNASKEMKGNNLVKQDAEIFEKALAEISTFPKIIEMDRAQDKTKNVIYSPLEFDHAGHAEDISCNECHHAIYEVKAGARFSCSESNCHHKYGINMDTEDKYKTYYRAMHKREDERSCLGCHEYLKENNLEYGPIGCFSCHEKF